MARPYWTGEIRISLVGLAVEVFPATERGSQVPLHEYDRRTGDRIHHQNINESGEPVDDQDIVKGYEFEKGNFVLLESEEIAKLKLVSSDTLLLENFMAIADLPLVRLERPYFILPQKKKDAPIYHVLREAMRESAMAGVGQITLRGREELCAVLPLGDGLVLETLRYDSEIKDAEEFFSDLQDMKIKKDQVALARRLIEENAQALDFGIFHDHYHEALLDLVQSKKNKKRPRFQQPIKKPEKVIDFMEALQRSLKQKAHSKKSDRAPSQRKHG